MARPTTTVTMSFGTFYYGLTSFVRNVDIRRGISRELEDYSAGQATIVLSNRNRYFDPTNTSSPLNGYIRPGMAIKIVSNDVTIFVGYIDSWSFDYPENGTDATATIQCSDALSFLAKIETADIDVPVQLTGDRISTVLNDSSVSWTKTTRIDSGTKTVADNTILAGTNALEYLQSIVKNEPGDLYVNKDGWLCFADNRWVNNPVTPTVRTNLCINPSFESNTTSWTGVTRVTTGAVMGTYAGQIAGYTNAIYTRSATTAFKKNTYYTLSFYADSVSFIQVTFKFTDSVTGLSVSSSTYVSTSGRVTLISPKHPYTNAVIPEITITNTSGSNLYVDAVMIEEGQTADYYFDGSGAYGQAAAPAGFSWAFAWTGTTNNSTSTLTLTPVQPVDYSSVTYYSDSAGTAIQVNDIGVSVNSENLYNDVTVAGSVLTGSRVYDGQSKYRYGLRSYSFLDSELYYDTEADALANYWLAIFKDPEFRADSMGLQLNSLGSATQGTVLATDIRSQISLQFTPVGGGSAIDKFYSVIGVNHTIDPESHYMSFALSSLQNQPFRLDSIVAGVLDRNVLG